MKKLSFYVFLVLLFNFYFPVQADHAPGSPKDYYKGKFYNSVKNNFLVAREKMVNSIFANTVIAILKNNESGAFGLVINKPLGFVRLNFLLSKLEDRNFKKNQLYNVEVPVYWGGPVDENIVLVLHTKEYQNASTKKYNKISVSSGYKILIEIANKKGPKKSLILLGHSGWGSGQLEGEMERELWILSELNTDLIFEIENTNKWLNAINNSFIGL